VAAKEGHSRRDIWDVDLGKNGKTIAILAVLINIAAKAKTEISVVSESVPHLRRGAIKDFAKVMQWTGRWAPDRWNKTLLTYHFANGSTIEFFSADSEGRLRGARRQVLYINEANNIDFESLLPTGHPHKRSHLHRLQPNARILGAYGGATRG
jgi:phage terminase large subunit-like protein